jgi:hypothetical protein
MKKIFFLSAIIFNLTSYGCKCHPYIGEILATHVFVGTVSKVEVNGRWSKVYMAVENNFKGNSKTGKTVVIKTRSTSGSCGFKFYINKKYIVYGKKHFFQKIRVTECSFTMDISSLRKEDIKIEKGRDTSLAK